MPGSGPTMCKFMAPFATAAMVVVALTILARPAPSNADDTNAVLHKAMQSYQASIANAETLIQEVPGVPPQERAEGYRYLIAQPRIYVEMAVQDPGHPYFLRSTDDFSKFGLDNVDNLYGLAIVNGDADYRIFAAGISSTDLVFQCIVGMPGNNSLGRVVDTIDMDRIKRKPDGSYEIIVSPHPHKGNWLKCDSSMGAGPKLPLPKAPSTPPSGPPPVQVSYRQTFSDWEHQNPTTIYIESIGHAGTPSRSTTPELMAHQIEQAGRLTEATVRYWFYLNEVLTGKAHTNELPKPWATVGGVAGQYLDAAPFKLANDEALVFTVKPSKARYMGVMLSDRWWFVSFDYRNHQSTLATPGQTRLGSDGVYRFVVSARDPGVSNWLDPAGHPEGAIFMRWQGLKSGAAPEQPVSKVVKFDQVRKEFPADEPVISAGQRRQAVAARALAVARRFAQ
jgi:hypothetical protein